MRKFEVKFELYNKKMKTVIEAGSREEAKDRIRNRIIFHEVQLIQDDKTLDDLKNMLGIWP